MLIENRSDNTWVEDIEMCDGANSTILSTRRCVLSMIKLRETYGYQFRDLVTLKFRSYNRYGWSLNYSPTNTVGATIKV